METPSQPEAGRTVGAVKTIAKTVTVSVTQAQQGTGRLGRRKLERAKITKGQKVKFLVPQVPCETAGPG
jgi:hypothetical protein